jgi:Helicase HerA, central domain/TraM recognition site of TraD and TraG
VADRGALVPFESSAPGLAEQLTRDFYVWEARGRGWRVWPYPVALEPALRPFFGHFVDPSPAFDDARKPTLLGKLVDLVRAGFKGRRADVDWQAPAPDALSEGPEPAVYWDESGLIELRVSLPPQIKVTSQIAEQFLLSLSYCAHPLSFEVAGLPNAIIVQIACRESDAHQVRTQLGAHFPDARLEATENFLRRRWRTNLPRLIIDFGLSEEFMRPLRAFSSFDPDPLIGIAGALAGVAHGEMAFLQVLFEAAREPWAENILRAVTDWEGRPFFADAPEMLALARQKVERPLFAVALRIAAQSPEQLRARELVRAIGAALTPLAAPGSNELIPLTNRDYDFELHEEDLLLRRTHRSGMILNSAELVSLVHPPSASVRAEKLARESRKTKAAPPITQGHALVLGENTHQGRTTLVTVGTEQRLRHTHIVGATGTGKSTLLLNLITQDIAHGIGVGVIDPHGDLVDEILGRVPERRWDDVVLFDPADADYPVGFNILSAHSDVEKTILTSDLGTVFKRFASSWGDQMTSVLGNAILAFLESAEGGTLLDLRRFLVEPQFRNRVLRTVKDPHVRSWWERDFALLKGSPQASILTRLDTFLRPKLVRNIVAQKESRLRFDEILNTGKILLVKLAQGLIGEENAYLLGAFLVSKLHQVVMARQELRAAERKDFFLYIDEFQNFITPSLASILSGARKYRLGLILAHQDLRQLWSRDTDVASAVIANPSIRVCFRLGDFDAQKLKGGFASFDPHDLQSLGVGEAIARIERADYDFNLRTLPLPPVGAAKAERTRERLIALSRQKYASARAQVEAAQLPEPQGVQAPSPPVTKQPTKVPKHEAVTTASPIVPTPVAAEAPRPPEQAVGRGGAQHKYLQHLIKRFAEDKGWRVTIEKPVMKGLGSVDVALERDGVAIACEISVSSSVEQEFGNIEKCLAAGFEHVVAVSADKKTIAKLRQSVSGRLDEKDAGRVQFLLPEELFSFLEGIDAQASSKESTVRGYKVKVRYQPMAATEKKARSQAVAETVARALARLRNKR